MSIAFDPVSAATIAQARRAEALRKPTKRTIKPLAEPTKRIPPR